MTMKSNVVAASLALLCVAALAPQPASAGGSGPAAHRNWLKVTEAKTNTQSDQFRWRNPVDSRGNVKFGDRNTLSPQPLPPGGGGRLR